MKRRDFVTGVGAAGALAACAPEPPGDQGPAIPEQRFRWNMVTTWPPNFPGLGSGAAVLARNIQAMSGGRIQIKVYAAGELIPAFEVFDAVSRGTADIGHGAAYYWKGKTEAAQFFTSIPFGLNAHEMNGWLYFGGGLELWQALYEPFNLVPWPSGNTGVQMGGWFNRKIQEIADLKGLKMRIPGIGGEVLKRAGGTPVSLPGSEIFTALQTGSIDATEWIGPYNDLAFGLNQVARYYYYPGWHEPGPALECIINRDKWLELPEDLQAIVRVACAASTTEITAEFMARNAQSLATLQADPDVEILALPDAVLGELKRLTTEILEELAERDENSRKIWDSYKAFLATSAPWQNICEVAFLKARDG
jgi:TRAP-type mannitol/chloroaromatic compound transport system substrate-binding protein